VESGRPGSQGHAPGWMADPLGRHQFRYWNGTTWTEAVSTNGSQETDPLGISPAAPGNSSLPRAADRAHVRWRTPVRVLLFGGAAGLAIGALLPWVKAEAGIFSATKNGIEGDGVLTLLLAIAIALVCWLARRPRRAAVVAIVLAGLAAAIGIYDMVDITNKANDLASSTAIHVSATIGVGLWLTVLAAVAVIIGAFIGFNDAKVAPTRLNAE
jgi:Protein of unknown function (DUF2510)